MERMNIGKLLPEVYKSMYALSIISAKSNLTNIQRELIKIRASQINGCAFCIDMHTKDALKYGETQQRIFLLNAWRETSLFTDEEKAILAITEEVTLISQHGLTEATYNNAMKYFSEETIAQIIMSVVVINAWNRISVSSHTEIPE
ncbi:carboxymuconolactone decarboxylase family protein [Polluticoccus soli]|uniref:carboxymuconolactone decarboxylase family protein n=1 Tax=Polluticoccus soli TaxID=3034150 RepID=UPI0023E11560|nr:carboxymuconolactone decarboxylase family protein [Flavipsychrobacter sp. JY13-12]